ncbi:hypothetical protein HDU83_008096 [Entophlyctis luteolus]|nr:hypothetical protein HDU82_001878 [Entophlyctis luteolus]KAJ3357283.1 hypothetical protein HDU83_008096 [Entophlyctis luteolus]KAJ3394408.1 hypothetical protein HDU84_008404 [Entophlyctis sp. JEL0112]
MLLSYVVTATLTALAIASPIAIAKRDALDGFNTKCSKSSDTFTITSLTYTPNPITAGSNVTVSVTGTSTKDIVTGASVHVVATILGFITVLDKTIDVCSAEGVSCPIVAANNEVVAFQFDVAPGTPSLTVDVKATLTNADGSEIVCVENSSLSV